MACRSGLSRWAKDNSGPLADLADPFSRIARSTAATGSSQSRARTNCSPVACFISSPVPIGRELRNGSFTSSTPVIASTSVSAPATASFESPRAFATVYDLKTGYSGSQYNRQRGGLQAGVAAPLRLTAQFTKESQCGTTRKIAPSLKPLPPFVT